MWNEYDFGPSPSLGFAPLSKADKAVFLALLAITKVDEAERIEERTFFFCQALSDFLKFQLERKMKEERDVLLPCESAEK